MFKVFGKNQRVHVCCTCNITVVGAGCLLLGASYGLGAKQPESVPYICTGHTSLYQPILLVGVVSRTLGIMPEKAFKMQSWIMVGRFMERNFEEPTIFKWLVAGSAAGAATTIIGKSCLVGATTTTTIIIINFFLSHPARTHTGCPSERAMVLAHIRKQAFTAVIKSAGIRGLYFGFRSTLYRDISFNAVFFTMREVFVKLHRKHYGDADPWVRVMLGFPAGTLASIVACPFDVVKTRQQGSALGE